MITAFGMTFGLDGAHQKRHHVATKPSGILKQKVDSAKVLRALLHGVSVEDALYKMEKSSSGSTFKAGKRQTKKARRGKEPANELFSVSHQRGKKGKGKGKNEKPSKGARPG